MVSIPFKSIEYPAARADSRARRSAKTLSLHSIIQLRISATVGDCSKATSWPSVLADSASVTAFIEGLNPRLAQKVFRFATSCEYKLL